MIIHIPTIMIPKKTTEMTIRTGITAIGTEKTTRMTKNTIRTIRTTTIVAGTGATIHHQNTRMSVIGTGTMNGIVIRAGTPTTGTRTIAMTTIPTTRMTRTIGKTETTGKTRGTTTIIAG